MTDTIRAAAKATEMITQHVATATVCVREFGDIGRNAIGILTAPGEQRREITLAIHALRKALDLLDGTNWPDDTDYHAL